MTRIFATHLSASDNARYGGTIEIQVLAADGRARDVASVDVSCESLTLAGCEIGRAVVQRAAALPEGQGTYLDLAGNEIPPFLNS